MILARRADPVRSDTRILPTGSAPQPSDAQHAEAANVAVDGCFHHVGEDRIVQTFTFDVDRFPRSCDVVMVIVPPIPRVRLIAYDSARSWIGGALRGPVEGVSARKK